MKVCFTVTACAASCLWMAAQQPVFGAQTSDSLFDGETFDAWTTLNGEPVKKGWEIVDGTIHLDTSGGRPGHIVTKREFGDFDLRFEWKISSGGNSGVKYRVREYGKRVLGCEYQIIDDDAYLDRGRGRPKGTTGSIYDLYAPNDAKHLKPAGEFNQSRIVIRGNRIQHWLNGHLIVSACVGSCDWYRKKEESKFSDVAGFGENRFGKIMLTDHRTEVWYRNMVMKELPQAAHPTPVGSRRFSGRRLRAGLGRLFGGGSVLRRHR